MTDHELEGYNKFVPYYLHPRLHLQCGTQQEQLPDQGLGRLESVDDGEPMENLAKICERYGGGGHARVGAISFPPDRLTKRGGRRRRLSRSCARVTRRRWGGRRVSRKDKGDHGSTRMTRTGKVEQR